MPKYDEEMFEEASIIVQNFDIAKNAGVKEQQSRYQQEMCKIQYMDMNVAKWLETVISGLHKMLDEAGRGIKRILLYNKKNVRILDSVAYMYEIRELDSYKTVLDKLSLQLMEAEEIRHNVPVPDRRDVTTLT